MAGSTLVCGVSPSYCAPPKAPLTLWGSSGRESGCRASARASPVPSSTCTAGDSSSGHPPSPARLLAAGPATAPLTLREPRLPSASHSAASPPVALAAPGPIQRPRSLLYPGPRRRPAYLTSTASLCPAHPASALPAPRAPRELEQQVGLCLPQKSYLTYLSSPPRSAPTPGKQTRMESRGAARRRCPPPGTRPAAEGESSAWVAQAAFPAMGN